MDRSERVFSVHVLANTFVTTLSRRCNSVAWVWVAFRDNGQFFSF